MCGMVAILSGFALASEIEIIPLGGIEDETTAVDAVKAQAERMSDTIHTAEGVDLVTLYAEAAISSAASRRMPGSELYINRAALLELQPEAIQTREAVKGVLTSKGVDTLREVSNAVTFKMMEIDITIHVDPDILSDDVKDVDFICVDTVLYKLTLQPSSLAHDLTEPLTIVLKNVEHDTADPMIAVSMSNMKLAGYVTLSLPADSRHLSNMAVTKINGDTDEKERIVSAGRYNAVTSMMDGKIDAPGEYRIEENSVDFMDLNGIRDSMQTAINELYAQGIADGQTSDKFGPNDPISRGAFVKLIMRAIHKDSFSGESYFPDIDGKYYYKYANAAKAYGIIDGYSDNCFHGDDPLKKGHICKIVGNVMKLEKQYKTPYNVSEWLQNYRDGVPSYAREMTALLTRAKVISYLPDYLFEGDKNMTRGEVAEILYAMMQKM